MADIPDGLGAWVKRQRQTLPRNRNSQAALANLSETLFPGNDKRQFSREWLNALENERRPNFDEDKLATLAQCLKINPPSWEGLLQAFQRAGKRPFFNGDPGLTKPLVGREALLQDLANFWQNQSVGVFVLTGVGGEGKTAVARQFVDNLLHSKDDKRDGIFWWKFGDSSNVEQFLEEAYKYFYPNAAERAGINTPYGQALKIASQLEKGRYFVVLDEFEWVLALDRPRPSREYIKTVLFAFGQRNLGCHNSFCLVNSREELPWSSDGFDEKKLEGLELSHAVDLLRSLGRVHGADQELCGIAVKANCHPMYLSLLQGDASKIDIAAVGTDAQGRIHQLLERDRGRFITDDWKLLCRFSAYRGEVERDGLALLMALGKRHQEDAEAINETEVVERLEKGRILLQNAASGKVRLHPFVRNYYQNLFQIELSEEDRKQTHLLIANYYLEDERVQNSPERPELHDLAPVIEAVYHLCKAGKYDQAWEVTWEKLSRGPRYLLALELGAWDTGLSILQGFFFDNVPQVGDPMNQAHLLSILGFAQTSQGELREAERLHEAAYSIYDRLQPAALATNHGLRNWTEKVGYALRNWSENLIYLGSFDKAEETIQKALKLADNEVNCTDRFDSLAYLLWVYHLINRSDKIDQLLAIPKEDIPRLRSAVFCFGGVILSEIYLRRGWIPLAEETLTNTYSEAIQRRLPVTEARCFRLMGWMRELKGENSLARTHYQKALDLARRTPFVAERITAIQAWARFNVKHFDPDTELAQLEPMLQIARNRAFRYFEADLLVTLAWVRAALGNTDSAKSDADSALNLAKDMNYHWGIEDANRVLEQISRAK